MNQFIKTLIDIIKLADNNSGLLTAISLLTVLLGMMHKKYRQIITKNKRAKRHKLNNRVEWTLRFDSNKECLILDNNSGRDIKDDIKLYKVIYCGDHDFKRNLFSYNNHSHYLSFINLLGIQISQNNIGHIKYYKISKEKFDMGLRNYFHLGSTFHYLQYSKHYDSLPNYPGKGSKIKYNFNFDIHQELKLYFHSVLHPKNMCTLIFKRIPESFYNEKYVQIK